MSETVESLDEWVEAIEDAEGGSVILFDETRGTKGIGRTDLAGRLALRLVDHFEECEGSEE